MDKSFSFRSLIALLITILAITAFSINFVDIYFLRAKYIFAQTNTAVNENILALKELKVIIAQKLGMVEEIIKNSEKDEYDPRAVAKLIQDLKDKIYFAEQTIAKLEGQKDLVLMLENLWLDGYYNDKEKQEVCRSASEDLDKLKEQLKMLKNFTKKYQKLSRVDSALFYFE